MNIEKVDYREDKAEGVVMVNPFTQIPYDTELVSGGVAVHFWSGGQPEQTIKSALKILRKHRDIVGACFSEGWPTDFWARVDVK